MIPPPNRSALSPPSRVAEILRPPSPKGHPAYLRIVFVLETGKDGFGPRQQCHEPDVVAREHREIRDFRRLHDGADPRLRHFDDWRGPRYGERLAQPGDSEREVKRERRTDDQGSPSGPGPEPGQLRSDLVRTGGKPRKAISSGLVGDGRANDPGARVRGGDRHSGQDRITLVDDSAIQRAQGLPIGQPSNKHHHPCGECQSPTSLRIRQAHRLSSSPNS